MNRINIYYLLVCNIYIFKLDENFKYNLKNENLKIYELIYICMFFIFLLYIE